MYTTLYKFRYSRKRSWKQLVAVVLLVGNLSVQAQQVSQGGTAVLGGTDLSLHGNHSFQTGSGLILPGKIATERQVPFGLVSFNEEITHFGAADASFVDGYVLKRGNGPFVFPVGDNEIYRPFGAAEAEGISGAYFRANPSTAVTSRTIGDQGNFPVLPIGGPFDLSAKAADVNMVSTTGYWDIDGEGSTSIILSWNIEDDIETLTSSTLSNLTIVGWTDGKWVKIPSTVDETSLFGSTSTLLTGSITSNVELIPTDYLAFALAQQEVVPDLTPIILMSETNFSPSNTIRNFEINLYGVTSKPSSGPITIYVFKPSPVFSVEFSGSGWTSVDNGSYYTLTNTSAIIPGDFVNPIVINGTMTVGTGATKGVYNLRATIGDASGGELNNTNNSADVTVHVKP